MKVRADFVPETTDYLIQGKEYRAYDFNGFGFVVMTEHGDEAYCILDSCAHLGDHSWTIVEE